MTKAVAWCTGMLCMMASDLVLAEPMLERTPAEVTDSRNTTLFWGVVAAVTMSVIVYETIRRRIGKDPDDSAWS